MLEMLLVVAPLFLVIGLGNILKKTRLMPPDYIQTSNRLLMLVFAPALLFYKIHSSNLTEVFNPLHVSILIGATVTMFVISYPLGRLLKLSPVETNTFVSNNFRSNSTFIGLPVCYYVLGDIGLVMGSIILAFTVPLNNILGIIAFSGVSFSRKNLKTLLHDTLMNPILIGCILGIIFAVFHISLPSFLDRTFDIIIGVTMPIALLNIGADISVEYIRGNSKVIMIGAVMKLLVLPGLIMLGFIISGIHVFTPLEKVLVLLLASPSAQVNYVLSATMKGSPDLAIGGIVSSTILSAFTYLFWLSLFTFL